MARRPARRTKPKPASRGSRPNGDVRPRGLAPSEVEAARVVFWHNVVREFLTELATLSALKPTGQAQIQSQAQVQAQSQPAGAPGAITEQGSDGARYDPSLFDGRLAVVTVNGERIPLAEVSLLLAAGASDPAQRELSVAVECTVFQIRTPDGHVFTLPLHQIASIHAITPELLERLNKRAQARRERESRETEPGPVPFGFAAFTSLARGIPALSPLPGPAPEHPQE